MSEFKSVMRSKADRCTGVVEKANAQGSAETEAAADFFRRWRRPSLAGLPVELIRAPVPGYYGFTVGRVSGMMETKRVGGVP